MKKLLLFLSLLISFIGSGFSANYYWVHGSGDWGDYSHHWATTSGGSVFYASEPTLNDNVFFNNLSGFTGSLDSITVNSNISFHDMNWTGVTTNPRFKCGSNMDISGSLTFVPTPNMLFDNSGGQTTFISGTSEIIVSANQVFNSVTFNGNGSWTLQGYQLNVDNNISLLKGTLITNGYTVTCSKFSSLPPVNTNQRTLDIRNSVIKIKSSDNPPYLSWNVDNGGNSVHVISGNSTINFRGNNGISTMKAGCGLHYNDVNFLYDDGLLFVCTDTIRNTTFNYNGYVLGSSNIFNNVTIMGNGYIGDNSIILPLAPVSTDNNRFNTVDIYHTGRVYGNHNVFNNVLFSTHPNSCYYYACVYCGVTDNGELHGNRDTIFNLLSFIREGYIYGNQNVINISTFWCDGWIYDGSNKFDTLNLYRHYQECGSSVHANVLSIQSDSTQTITGAFNLLGPYYCEHTFIKSTTASVPATLYSIPVITLDYVEIKDLHAANSHLAADTATRSINISGNSNWEFRFIYQPIVADSFHIVNVHPCYYNSNGKVVIYAHGGTGKLQYSIWITNPVDPYFIPYWPAFQNDSTFTGLYKGNHPFRIIDIYGCLYESNITIGGPTQVVINSVQKKNISCFGYNNGELTIHASGGSGALHYSLDNSTFSTDTVFTNLGPGNYTVYVRDDSLCLASGGIYTITQPNKLLLSFFGIRLNAIKCRGDSTGVVKLSAGGGTLPYYVSIIPINNLYDSDTIIINSHSYNFNFSDNDSIILHGGHYTCIITDTNGCFYQSDFEIVEPTPIDFQFSVSDLSCYGDSTGSIYSNVSGATSPYQYLWLSDSSNTDFIDSLPAGDYILQIKDNNNCIYFDTAKVKSPDQIRIYLSQDSVRCFGEINGSASIDSITGGTTNYSAAWNSGEGSWSIQNKPAGVFTVTITDANNCAVIDSVKILQPQHFSADIILDSVSCYGGNNGKAKVVVSGGTYPYSYHWVNNQFVTISTSDSISGMPSDYYNLTISDAKGCDTTIVVFIPQPLPLQTSFMLGNSDCSGLSGGWTKVVVTGGVLPYSYVWLSGQSTDSIFNLLPGTYTVTITDFNGCIKIDSTVISSLNTNIITNNGCAGADNGTVKVIPIGGSTPYIFMWSTGGAHDTIQSLAPGFYFVTVTDGIGCTHTDTAEIISVSSITDTIIKSDVSCYGGSNGWANCFVSGGAFPYSYSWTSGSLIQAAVSIQAGNYFISITDNNGCIKIDSVIITQPPLLGINIDSANINCTRGDSSGWIHAIPYGGTASYSYHWNTGNTTDIIDSLTTGTYIITVKDSLLCSVTDTIQITKPSLSFSHADIDCYGDNTGWIKANVSGGTVPYQFNWNPNLSPLTDSVYNLLAGYYVLTVTDNFGCSLKDSIEITQNSRLQVIFNYSYNKCYGDSTAWVQAIVNGGTRFSDNTYNYLWNTGDSTSLINNLIAGTYVVTITDSLGCVKRDTFIIQQPLPLNNSFSSGSVSCFGGNNGWAKAITNGGTSPFYYDWTPYHPNEDSIFNLVSGSYYLNITDSNNCVYNDSLIIIQPSQIVLVFTTDSTLCHGDSNGMATITANGGTPPYQYLWNNMTHSANDTILYLPSRFYTVTVTDTNNCIVVDSIKVPEPDELIVTISKTDINCNGYSTGSAQANVTGGIPVYAYRWSIGGTTQLISGLTSGHYWVTVTDANGCSKSDSIEINQSLPISFVVAPDTLICYGTSAYLYIRNLTGGTPGYNASWQPTGSTSFNPTVNPLVTTQFIVIISDSYGCFARDTVIINVNPQLFVNAGVDRTICLRDTASIQTIVSGGVSPYSYRWTPGIGLSDNLISNPIASPTSSTTYSVIVNDTSNCSATDNIIININPLPGPLFSFDTVCFRDSTRFTNLSSVSPAINSFSWLFGDGATSVDLNPVHKYNSPGYFNVALIAFAANGCIDTVIHRVMVDSLPTPDFTFTNACLGQTTYFTNMSTGGGTNITSYLWDLGDGTHSVAQNPFHFYAIAQDYAVKLKVFNNNGCSDSVIKIISINALPVASFNTVVSCYGDSLHIQNLSVPANSFDNWNWNFGDGDTSTTLWNPVHFYDNAGIYYITLLVKDTAGCMGSMTRQQIITPAPYANFAYSRVCFGDTTRFTDLSNYTFYSINSWKWYFGDGNTSTAQNPNHFYSHPGSYQVSLKVTNTSFCYDSISLRVIVDSLPVSDFIANTTCFNNATAFTDLSQSHGSMNNSWYWEFGDGNSGYYQNPVYTYITPSTYNARLIITNQRGCKDTASKTVTVNPLPHSGFSYSNTCLNDSTRFTSLSTTNPGTIIDTYLWEFGDGDSSSIQNPGHVYALAGSYNVKLTITNSNGCIKDTMITITINPLPDVNFSYTQTCLNDTTHFTDLSVSNGIAITNRDWDFGSGNTSVNQNPSIVFPNAGSYIVSLRITDLLGCNAAIYDTVVVDSLPVAKFISDTVCLNNPVQYTDLSESHGSTINYWHWYFSDSTNIYYQNPQHEFTTDTASYVRLLVINQMGCKDSTSHRIYSRPIPIANFIYSDTGRCFNDTTRFTSTSTAGYGSVIVSYHWDFSDGGTSTLQNPDHIFNSPGTYTVKLSVVNSNNCPDDTSILITINPLQRIDFSYSQTCLHDSTHFTDLTFSNIPLIKWRWNFGDGDSDTLQNPVHLYDSARPYSVGLTLTDSLGCSATKHILIGIDSLPVADFISDTVCINGATRFTDLSESHGSMNNSWYWQFGEANVSYIQSPLHAYSYSYPYTAILIISNQKGCKDTVSRQVAFNYLPVSFTYSNTCLHETTRFTFQSPGYGAPIISYFWNFGDGIDSISTLQNPTHIYAVPGSYFVKLVITNADSCSSDTTIAVAIYPTPEVNFNYTQTCFHQTTHFTNLSNSVFPIDSVKWIFTPVDSSDAYNPSFTFNAEGAFSVSLRVTDTTGCSASKIRIVLIDSLPQAGFTTNIACFNSPTEFTDQSIDRGSANNSWYWQYGDSNYGNNHYVEHTYNITGVYNATLIVTNENGCTDTVTNPVFVNNPLNIAGFTYNDTCLNNATHFTSTSTTYPGATIVSYLWNFGDGNIFNTSLPDTSHIYASPGSYYVRLTITNSDNCTKDTMIMVTIYPLPDIHFSYTQACLHNTTQFINQTNSNAGVNNWSWNFGDGSPSSTAENPGHPYSTADSFYVQLTGEDILGCRNTLISTVIVDSLPVADFNADTVCLNDATHFIDRSVRHGSPINYWQWNFGDGDTAFFQSPDHTYNNTSLIDTAQLIVANVMGCRDTMIKQVILNQLPYANFTYTGKCWHDSTMFSSTSVANGGTITSYFWNFGDGYTSNDTNPTHVFAVPGIYNVVLRVTNSNSCLADTTIQVEIYSLPIAEFSSPATGLVSFLINFNDISIPGSAPISTLIWDTNGVFTSPPPIRFNYPGNYDVGLVVIDSNGCRDTVVHQIMIGSNIIIGFTANDTCLGSPTNFTDTSNALPGTIISWDWDFGDGDTSFIQNPIHTYLNTGTYNVALIVRSSLNYSDTLIKQVHIFPNPVVYFTADITDSCAPLTVVYTDSTQIESGNLSRWLWDFSDSPPSTDHPKASHTFYYPGNYDVTLTVFSDVGCQGTFTVNNLIWVRPVPVAGFVIHPVSTSILEPGIKFTDISSGSDTIFSPWNWDFGDGNHSNIQNPSHLYDRTGFYWVTLTVYNVFGCWDSIGGKVWIKGEDTFYAPNAFTPNDDALNKGFLPVGTFNKEAPFEMKIFNRWGEPVFEINKYIPWLGTANNGGYCKEDVYIWVVSYTDINGLNRKATGWVMLLR